MIKPIIKNKLYIGDYNYLSGIDFIKNTITILFDCSMFYPTPRVHQLFKKHNITYIKSFTNDTDVFDIILEFKNMSSYLTNNDVILICCDCAISRSISYSIMMLIHEFQFTLKDALILMKKIQPKMSPNSGFIKQLIVFEQFALGNNSINYKDYLKMHFSK